MNDRRLWLSLMLVILCAAGGTARAESSLDVEVGWEGHYRAGRWAPLFVTVADTSPRACIIEVSAPHSPTVGMLVSTQVTASATPATYPIYVPLGHGTNDVLVVLRDARTQRRLAEWPPLDDRMQMRLMSAPVEVLIGTAGRGPSLRTLAGAAAARQARVELPFLAPAVLPSHPTGYDSFDGFVLNQPDLNQLSFEQQQALIDWVRCGGRLIMWPGPDPLPPASPIVAALPVSIGENITLRIDPKLLQQAGLAERFGETGSRAMTAREDAEAIELFGAGGPVAWRRDCGLGQITVLPIDPTFFVFSSELHAANFWRPLLRGIIDIPEAEEQPSTAYRGWGDASVQRRSFAFRQLSDRLGDVPGAGQFGFSYVAIVLIALMLIVGPIDWLVLRYLGRQPWTWFTTTGWIVLVTTGAIYVGHILKSGDLHYRSLRVIDQVDDATIAAHDLSCIYAPRTAQYEVRAEAESWWQPGADFVFGDRSVRADVPFHQGGRGNRPLAMRIGVWNLRFLEGESVGTTPPMIGASLRLRQTDDGPRVVGTITNLSSHALRDVRIRSRAVLNLMNLPIPQMQWWYAEGPARLEPGQAQAIDVLLGQFKQPRHAYGSGNELWMQANDLAAGRAVAIERLLDASDEYVCIYAEADQPAPAAKLVTGQPIEQHWQVIRALVRVAPEEQQP
jgi:hypothetical protein